MNARNRQRGRRHGRLVLAGLILGVLCSPLAIAQQPPATQPKTPPGTKPPASTKPKELTAAEKAAAAEQARINAEVLRLKSIKEAITKSQSKISQIYLSGAIAEQDKPEVNQFFNNYIEIMTSFAEATQAQSHRQVLRRHVRSIGNSKQDKSALGYVNAYLLQRLSEVAWQPPVNTQITPQARFVCMLAIGELNEVEPSAVGSGDVKPMPEALPELHKAIATADALPAVKVAALVGILRHAKYGITDKALEKKLVVDLANLVKQKTPGEGETVDGQQWIRRQAIEILGVLRQAGPNNEAIEPLVAALLDKTEPLSLRLDAARALGQIKVPANALGEEATPHLGELTLDVLRNEPNRRVLRVNLLSLQVGLRGPDGQSGIVTALVGQDRKNATELGRRIGVYTSFIASISQANSDPMVITQEMLKEADALETWLIEEVIGTEAVTNPAP